MAVTFMVGFEAQQAATDNVTLNGTSAYSTAQHRTGAASVRCNPASGASGYISALVTGGYLHFGLYIATLPSIERSISQANSSGEVRLTSDGHLKFYDNGTLRGTSSGTLSTATWYWIGLRAIVGTSVDCLQIDGSSAGITGNVASATTGVFFGASATEASAIDIYIDDVILDNGGFLAPSKVDTALPISDNTVTGVTGGAGGTTNLWDAVNNTPPAGVASASETNTTNIRFPASVTESYIANLETYTTLGVGASDTVIAVQAVIRHGEDIATGTKNGTLTGLVSNPNSSVNTAFVFGSDGGAHAAESGANFWVSLNSTIVTAPGSLTLGSSPQLKIIRASESRVGCVDFAGMVCAWTPAIAAAADMPYVNIYPPLLAQ